MKLTMKEIKKLIELEKKATKAPWKVIENEDDGGVLIGMDSYLKNPNNHYVNHLIEYADCIWPEDKSYSELKANADLISEMRWFVKAMAAQILKDQDVLGEAREYFDNLSDADCDQDGFIPNKEMTLLVEIEAALLPKE